MINGVAIIEGTTAGTKLLSALTNAEWNSLQSSGTTDLTNANAQAVAAGMVAVSLTLIITAGTVGVRFTGATDTGAAADATTGYPIFASSVSIPVRGMRDRSATPIEQITRVSLYPSGATGYAIVYWALPGEAS